MPKILKAALKRREVFKISCTAFKNERKKKRFGIEFHAEPPALPAFFKSKSDSHSQARFSVRNVNL
jgi:hypothetical protein